MKTIRAITALLYTYKYHSTSRSFRCPRSLHFHAVQADAFWEDYTLKTGRFIKVCVFRRCAFVWTEMETQRKVSGFKRIRVDGASEVFKEQIT